MKLEILKELTNKEVLVTGGCGFIGSEVTVLHMSQTAPKRREKEVIKNTIMERLSTRSPVFF